MLTKLGVPQGEEGELLRLFRKLGAEERRMLLRFGAFLATNGEREPEPIHPMEPQPLPRPPQETVVAAIKRLSQQYAMLDRSLILHETSGLMASHVLQGRPAEAVIDELEALFARHYAQYREQYDR